MSVLTGVRTISGIRRWATGAPPAVLTALARGGQTDLPAASTLARLDGDTLDDILARYIAAVLAVGDPPQATTEPEGVEARPRAGDAGHDDGAAPRPHVRGRGHSAGILVIGNGAVMVGMGQGPRRRASGCRPGGPGDGNAFLTVAAGVIVGYERNTTTNTVPAPRGHQDRHLHRAACWDAGRGPRCMSCPIERDPVA